MTEIIFNVGAEEKFDDTDNAWKYYEKKYGENLEDEKLYIKEKEIEIEVNGECVFNFGSKYKKLKDLIDKKQDIEDENKSKLIKKFERCQKLHHSLPNIMVLPKCGGLNTLKGKIYFSSKNSEWRVRKGPYISNEWFDRPDSLVCYISEYYEKKPILDKMSFKQTGEYLSNGVFTSAIIHGETFAQLLELLDSFSSVNDFCSYFYQINDKMINEWCKSGKCVVKDDIERYLNQALGYWSLQMKSIFKMLINEDEDVSVVINGENVKKYVQKQLETHNYNDQLIINKNLDSKDCYKLERNPEK